jgi:hypothetical protein
MMMGTRNPFPPDSARLGSAIVLLVAVSGIIASPVWHQGHHSLTLAVAEDGSEESELHLCSTGGHAVPNVSCPVCLSQRLLDHSVTETPIEIASPVLDSGHQMWWPVVADLGISRLARARGPPVT